MRNSQGIRERYIEDLPYYDIFDNMVLQCIYEQFEQIFASTRIWIQGLTYLLWYFEGIY